MGVVVRQGLEASFSTSGDTGTGVPLIRSVLASSETRCTTCSSTAPGWGRARVEAAEEARAGRGWWRRISGPGLGWGRGPAAADARAAAGSPGRSEAAWRTVLRVVVHVCRRPWVVRGGGRWAEPAATRRRVPFASDPSSQATPGPRATEGGGVAQCGRGQTRRGGSVRCHQTRSPCWPRRRIAARVILSRTASGRLGCLDAAASCLT